MDTEVTQLIQAEKTLTSRRDRWYSLKDSIVDEVQRLLGIQLSPKQEAICKSKASLVIIRSARGTGKSFLEAFMIYCMLYFSCIYNEPLYIVLPGPKGNSTKWVYRHLTSMLDVHPLSSIRLGVAIKFHNMDNQSNQPLKLIFNNGVEIIAVTADNPSMKDIRGPACDAVFVEEYGEIEYKDQLNRAVLGTFTRSHTINFNMIVGTPDVKGLGEEYETLVKLGKSNNPLYEYFDLLPEDNPAYNEDAKDLMRDILSAEGYAAEAEGEQAPSSQRLLIDFDKKKHMRDISYNNDHPYFIGVDFGPNNAFVIFLQLIDNIVYAVDEIPVKNSLVDKVVSETQIHIEARFQGNSPLFVGCDKAGRSKTDLVTYTAFQRLKQSFPEAKYSTHIQLVRKVNQTRLFRNLILQDRLIIGTRCEVLLRSMYMATADMSTGGWKKEKNIDHPLDALAYGLINHEAIAAEMAPKKESKTWTPEKEYELNTAIESFIG